MPLLVLVLALLLLWWSPLLFFGLLALGVLGLLGNALDDAVDRVVRRLTR